MAATLQTWNTNDVEGTYVFQYVQNNPRVYIFIYCKKFFLSGMANIEKLKIVENRSARIVTNVGESSTPSVPLGEEVEWEAESLVFTWNTAVELPSVEQDEAMSVRRPIRPRLDRESEGMMPDTPLRF